MDCFKILSQHLSESSEENYKTLSQDSYSMDSDLNLGFPNMKGCQVFDHDSVLSPSDRWRTTIFMSIYKLSSV
jgi:hypothetical protein